MVDNPIIEFQDWMMVDFPSVRRADAAGLINWEYDINKHDGRRSPFRYVHFNNMPSECIVARYTNGL